MGAVAQGVPWRGGVPSPRYTPLTHGEGGGPAEKAWRVLIVEDQEPLLELLRLTFEDEPFALFLARDGQEALEVARGVQPHLVITDLRMPRMDGLALIRALRREPGMRGVPIIVVTALANAGTELLTYGAGATAFFAKPFSPLALRKRAEHLLREAFGDP